MPATVNGTQNDACLSDDDSHEYLFEDELQFLKDTLGLAGAKEALEARLAVVGGDKSRPLSRDLSPLSFSLPRHAGYNRVLEIGRTRKNPVFLDMGCGFGNNVRKAVFDGYPSSCVLVTDSSPELWKRGQQLFQTYEETHNIPFIAGNPLDPYFLEAVYPFDSKPNVFPPDLSHLSSLNALHGQVSVISSCYLFDRFDSAANQLQLARAMAGLLSPEPGSMIIGVGLFQEGQSGGGGANAKYRHSPASWVDLWDGQLFLKNSVAVNIRTVESTVRTLEERGSQEMEWTIIRL